MWFLAEVDLAENDNLRDWRVIAIRAKGRSVAGGNLRTFGVEESFNEAKRKALCALREERNQASMSGRRTMRKMRKPRQT